MRALKAAALIAATTLAATGLTGCAGIVPNASQAGLPLWELGKPRPFADGAPVTVVAAGDVGMDTFALLPCNSGAICSGGRVGSAAAAEGSVVVSGLHDRIFHLLPGGTGHMTLPGGSETPLAWE
ncbi:hypothetical protein [Pseudoroseicyclus sp. CXY001]|uniref:hypothetical protein n=1 Tax=Pseudoroseicyclus sp. CXY001 TaxID=3242492 RepID=UPI003570C248